MLVFNTILAYVVIYKLKILADSITDVYQDIRGVALLLFYLVRVLEGHITIADHTLTMSLLEKASDDIKEPVNYFGILLDDLQYVSDYYNIDYRDLAARDDRTLDELIDRVDGSGIVSKTPYGYDTYREMFETQASRYQSAV